MEIKQYTRKPFPVNAVQVTLQNIEEVAEWCKGSVVLRPTKMMGTTTDLPTILIKGQGDNRDKDQEAALGSWVVEFKGNYRSYKTAWFESTFDEMPANGHTPTQVIVDEAIDMDFTKVRPEEPAVEIYTNGTPD